GIHAARASLAHPAWPLRLQGAQAGMREMRDCRYLQISGENLRRAGAAYPLAAAGVSRASRFEMALCRCTIMVAAKSGVRRLTMGIAMKPAISSPARKTVTP